ncbi:cytokine receptor-like factor 2 [Pteropus alecto]|uniref:cytokine receptor-like factor 2 n=1 Tax=Pteropus alecto TaxID=9402 RepID=UPI000D5338B5|nr:cytokine receptor-like factor 2 [Pteropus alecto]
MVAPAPSEQPRDSLQLHIVNFNFETVQVTWNASQFPAANLTLLYRLTGDPAYSRCAHYILRRGRTAGCLLAARGDLILSLSLWDGAASLFNQTLWTSDFWRPQPHEPPEEASAEAEGRASEQPWPRHFGRVRCPCRPRWPSRCRVSSPVKPSSPTHLSFQWHQDSVTVTCSNLSYRGLLYEVQLRSTFDTEWQSREEEACHVTVGGLDADKCYFLRARVRTEESSYGPDTYPSDWSEVAHLHRGELRESCQDRAFSPKFVSMSAAVVVLTLLLLLLFLWKLRSVKELVMPSVPDPKASFPGLFEAHRGDFQEWIHDTQNVAVPSKVEPGELACVLEDAPGVPLPTAQAATQRAPASPTPAHPQLCSREGRGPRGRNAQISSSETPPEPDRGLRTSVCV